MKEDTQMATKQMKRCSTRLAIREMQMKATMGPYYVPLGTAEQKLQTQK